MSEGDSYFQPPEVEAEVEVDREEHTDGLDGARVNNSSLTTPRPRTVAARKANARQRELFEQFWAAYPVKNVSRDRASKAYISMVPDAATHAALMAGVERWLESAQWTESLEKDHGRFIRHADKWLYDRAWEAEPPQRKRDALDEA